MAPGGGRPSAGQLVAMLLGALLAPLAMRGLVGLSAPTDAVLTAGGAADQAALYDVRADGPGQSSSTSPTTTPAPSTTAPTTTRPPSTTTTAAPTTTTARPATTTTTAPPPSPADQVLVLVNAARADAGCEPLVVDDRLEAAAQLHAEDMAARDYTDHVNPDGQDPTDRAAAQGYDGPVGENIAWGYPTAEAVMDGWMGSDGHRANIENCDYRVTGVGVESDGWYWAQSFGF